MKTRVRERSEETGFLWRRFKEKGDPIARNMLIEQYLPTVRHVAERIVPTLPRSVEIDDLTSAGVFGLIDAINGFDPGRGIKFETYCTTRIRGAILDELRGLDFLPRFVRDRIARVQAACDDLRARLGREPSDREVAEKVGLSVKKLRAVLRHVSALSSAKRAGDRLQGDGESQLDVLVDPRFVDPQDRLHLQDLVRLVYQSLSEQERFIVYFYFYREMTMKEIGHVLRLSESRVCQILSKLVRRVKRKLARIERELSA